MSGDEYWETLLDSAMTLRDQPDSLGSAVTASRERIPEAIETRMSGHQIGDQWASSLQALTDKGRAANSLPLPVKAGTRVRFEANAGSLLSYSDAPDPNAEGVVVEVKSASGLITSLDDRVFVRWDDGMLRAISAEHLRSAGGHGRTGSAHRVRVASLGDLSDFLKVSEETLVHKATKDLWAVKKDGREYVIERLFDDNGAPLKV